MKKLFLISLNVVVIVALGICYLQLLKLFIAQLGLLVNEPASTFVKIAHTGSAAALAMAVIFSVNAFVTRQSMLRLGQACGAVAFIWFYVVRAEGQSSIGLLLASFMVTYSLFALVAFTLGPIAIGYYLNRKKPLDGFLSTGGWG